MATVLQLQVTDSETCTRKLGHLRKKIGFQSKKCDFFDFQKEL